MGDHGKVYFLNVDSKEPEEREFEDLESTREESGFRCPREGGREVSWGRCQ